MSTIATSGLVRADFQQQILCGAALTDDLESRVLEQPRDPLAQEHRVVGEDDADVRLFASILIWGLDVDAGQFRAKLSETPGRGIRPSERAAQLISEAESSAFGMKPSAELPATSAPKSAPSRLEVRITRGGTSSSESRSASLEPVEVRQLHVHDRQVRAVCLRLLGCHSRWFRLRPRRRSRLSRAAAAPPCGRRCCHR